MKRILLAIFAAHDRLRWRLRRLAGRIRALYEQTPNAVPELQLCYQALADATDSLEAISQAIADGDGEEAQRLIALAHDSLTEHQTELKGQL